MKYLIFILFFFSCITSKPTEEVKFPYGQLFTATKSVSGYRDVDKGFKEAKAIEPKPFIFTEVIKFIIKDDGGGGNISWTSKNIDVYTENGKITSVTIYSGEGWTKYY